MAHSSLHVGVQNSIKDNKPQNIFYRIPWHGNISLLFFTIQTYYRELGFLVSLKQCRENNNIIVVKAEKVTNRFLEFSKLMDGLLEEMKEEKLVVMYKSYPHAKYMYKHVSAHYTMPWKYSLELLDDDIKITKR